MKLIVYGVAVCLHQASANRVLRDINLAIPEMYGSGRSPVTTGPKKSTSAHRNRLAELEDAKRAMQEVASIFKVSLDPAWRVTDPSEYISRCRKIIRLNKIALNYEGVRELESLRHEELLRYLFGAAEATRILVERGLWLLRIAASENPHKTASMTHNEIVTNPLESLRDMASTLIKWNAAYMDEFIFARPKYKHALVFFVGTSEAETVLSDSRKSYSKKLARSLPHRKSIRSKLRLQWSSDADRIYRALEENLDNLKTPFHILSYENQDGLIQVLGERRATELVKERGQLVLSHLLGRSVGKHEDILSICAETIAQLSSPKLIEKVTVANELYLWFLLGPKVGSYIARNGFQWKF